MPPVVSTVVSSGNTAPPAAAAAAAETVIEPVSLCGRTISSLRRATDGHHYILLEAVCRVFFPHQRNVSAFMRAADTLFDIPDWRMSDVEQRQFISFYRLPTDRLTHNKLIRLDLLTDILPSLQRMFAAPARVGVADGQLIGTVIPRPPSYDSATAQLVHTVPPTAANNNNNDDDDKTTCIERPRRKRRRHDVDTDVVVID